MNEQVVEKHTDKGHHVHLRGPTRTDPFAYMNRPLEAIPWISG